MVLNGIGASAGRRAASLSRSVDETAAPEQRALVAVEPGESPCPTSHRPSAPFLAHLIATERGEPQTRERRRATPAAAAQAYAATRRLNQS